MRPVLKRTTNKLRRWSHVLLLNHVWTRHLTWALASRANWSNYQSAWVRFSGIAPSRSNFPVCENERTLGRSKKCKVDHIRFWDALKEEAIVPYFSLWSTYKNIRGKFGDNSCASHIARALLVRLRKLLVLFFVLLKIEQFCEEFVGTLTR